MKELLACFEYIKRYHIDMLDSIGIMLEFFILKNLHSSELNTLINLGKRRKLDSAQIISSLQKIAGENYIPINPKINFLKILRTLQECDTSLRVIEEFMHIITQKKTTHNLFYYSTPLELNELLVRLLDVQNGESIYNPCYGIGSLFLMISALNANGQDLQLFGEELDAKLANIAKLTCKLAKISTKNLVIHDILKAPFFEKKFDKIICNPPFQAHIGIEYLKDDVRFKNIYNLAKSYPEWTFLIHALWHLKRRAVFILRSSILQKSSLEPEFNARFFADGLIEAIIELPKNIFPHQNYDFCILVLSPNNKEILSIDAKGERFCKRDGKYNRLVNIDLLLDVFTHKKESEFSFKMKYEQFLNSAESLPISRISQSSTQGLSLDELGVEIFRPQRVYGGKNDIAVEFYDVGMADFSEYGLSQNLSVRRDFGEIQKVKKFALNPYDICLSLRGNLPKVSIFGEIVGKILAVPNAGIVVVRCKNKTQAIALYCYFFSHQGQEVLKNLYEQYAKKGVDVERLKTLKVPFDFENNALQKFEKICSIAEKIQELKNQIERFR